MVYSVRAERTESRFDREVQTNRSLRTVHVHAVQLAWVAILV